MTGKRISIKFCGGCNPRIDRGEVAQEVRDALREDGYEVVYNTLDADIVVYLSGCASSCSQRYSEKEVPGVIVAGETIDSWPVDERQLAREIVTKVRTYRVP